MREREAVMPTAQLSNLDIYYEVHGQGPAVTLIAGYTCDHTFWGGVLPILAERYQVVVLDNRGIGRTVDDGKLFSVECMAADIVALIEHLGLLRPAVIGQSMGGLIAQAVVKNHPEVCSRYLILNSAQAFRATAVMALKSLLDLRKEEVDFDLLIDTTLPWMSGSDWLSRRENVTSFKSALRGNPAPQSVTDQERQLTALASFDARAWNLPRSHPAFVISATEDALIPPPEGQALAASLGAGSWKSRAAMPAAWNNRSACRGSSRSSSPRVTLLTEVELVVSVWAFMRWLVGLTRPCDAANARPSLLHALHGVGCGAPFTSPLWLLPAPRYRGQHRLVLRAWSIRLAADGEGTSIRLGSDH